MLAKPANWLSHSGLPAFIALTALATTTCGVFADDKPRAVQTYSSETITSTTSISAVTELTAATTADSNGGVGSSESAENGQDDTRTDGQDPAGRSRPDWLGTRTLPTTSDGRVVPQTTPPELKDRRLPTIDTLPPPSMDAAFLWTIEPLDDEVLSRSTWVPGCPVEPEDLSYLTLSFWGFDDRPHTGEMIVSADVAEDIVSVFQTLFQARFPIEEMRIVTEADLDAPPTGDGNNTGSFVCRPVTGGTKFSQHAYGLAIDINPFLNPYQRGELVLPELATAYLDRTSSSPGLITDGDVVVQAFEAIGWHWGGRWSSLRDYQHFSWNNR